MTTRMILAAALALGTSGVAFSAAADTELTLQLGWLPNAASAGEIAALEMGFFADAGLDVSILPGGPNVNTIQELMGGSVDVVIAYAPQIMYAVNRGLPIASFGASFQEAPLTFYSLAEKEITSVADWAGMRVGAAPSAAPQVAVLLDNAELSMDDITFVQANVPALMQDQADVVAAWPTNVAQIGPLLEHEAGYNTQSIWDNGLQFQSNYYVAQTSLIEGDAAALEAFMAAADRGWAWVADNQAEAVEMLIGFAPALNADLETAALEIIVADYIYNAETATHGFGYVSPERWQETLDRYAALGEISSALTAADVHTGAILDAVDRQMRD